MLRLMMMMGWMSEFFLNIGGVLWVCANLCVVVILCD